MISITATTSPFDIQRLLAQGEIDESDLSINPDASENELLVIIRHHATFPYFESPAQLIPLHPAFTETVLDALVAAFADDSGVMNAIITSGKVGPERFPIFANSQFESVRTHAKYAEIIDVLLALPSADVLISDFVAAEIRTNIDLVEAALQHPMIARATVQQVELAIRMRVGQDTTS